MKDKILVTGANGFIGLNLVKKLIREGYPVTAVIRSKKKLEELQGLNVKIKFADITDKKSLANLLKTHPVVVHLAATKSNWLEKEDIFKVNSYSVANLFSRNTKHLIITSSVYALGRLGNLVGNESSKLKAFESYGSSKILLEELTKRFAEEQNIPYTIIRPSIVYGPGDSELGLVSKMIKLVNKKIFPLIGNGKNSLHLIYIDDLTSGFLQVIKKGGYNQTYIMAGADNIKLSKLIELIKGELGVSYKNISIPKGMLLFGAYFVNAIFTLGKLFKFRFFLNDPPITPWKVITLTDNWKFSIQKAKKELQFNPKINYQDGIKKTVEDFKTND